MCFESLLFQCSFDPLGNFIVACFCDHTIRAWDFATLSPSHKLKLPEGTSQPDFTCFAMSSDSKYIVTGGNGNILFIWEFQAQVRQLAKAILLSSYFEQY